MLTLKRQTLIIKHLYYKLKAATLVAAFFCGSCLLYLSIIEKDNYDKPEIKTRYFRFMSCSESNHGNWQDTSFIAATNSLEVIEQCLNELSLPLDQLRKFPLGNISIGSNGYNRNASHHFNWHFIEDS